MPVIRFMGNTMRRMSAGVQQARIWRQFRVLLCPSLAGIELLNDGGYYTAALNTSSPTRFAFHPLKRARWQ